MTPRIFIAAGLALLLFGVALAYAPWLVNWFGRLPGDINIERGNSRIFFPFTSLLLVSLVLTLVVNLFFRR